MNKSGRRRITRNREVKSCERCIAGKRKCDKDKPKCERCTRLGIICLYPTRAGLKKSALVSNSSEDSSTLHFLVEANNKTTSNNFQIVTNLTGEVSVFIPTNHFPFYGLFSKLDDTFTITQGNSGVNDVFDFSRFTTKILSLRQLKAKIPAKELGDHFISHFFSEIFPLVPIIDRDDFLLKWKTYWEEPYSFSDLNALILMFGVFFSSCVSIQLNSLYHGPPDFASSDLDRHKMEYFECVENIRYLLKTDICPSIPAISSLGLMYYVSSLNCYGLAAAISTLQRYCQMAGLHRKTSQLPEKPLKEILYGFVTYLDSLVSVYHGLPTQVDPRVSEITEISDALPESVHVLAFFARFFSARICARSRTSLNKINGPSAHDVRKLKKDFKKVQRVVKSINEKISDSQYLPTSDKDFVKAGNQLFLRRAAYFLVVMKIIVETSDQEKLVDLSCHHKELLIQSLLLMNESFILISQLPNSGRGCLWFARNTYPLEAILIVISNLETYPTEGINFSNLSHKERYTTCDSIDYISGDIRATLLEKCCDALQQIECLWPPVLRELFRKIVEIKERTLCKGRGSCDTTCSAVVKANVAQSTR
ncbi:hypothetical protein HG535_0C00140 [Zygotorulaspora mrakii]|uniref:Zn(2)-C6 fungal-type domain-containing protein n=1 Tax=Zygotorulaspora mrakii TaxID=42260 RepID=A0A7H9AZ27_ZYGMR|nr:uncharacterized protein HG535_0C00140 [Zygotorulaspora mrakii]QLG71668.1 hypothetical protein HG535_0C00140 [Zygotorulaspora mrakii]